MKLVEKKLKFDWKKSEMIINRNEIFEKYIIIFYFYIYGSNSSLYKKKWKFCICVIVDKIVVLKCHQVHTIIWPKVITDIVRSDHSIGQQGQI
jgi:hypothetical protein